MIPLPIVPPRYADEDLSGWMCRVSQVYGLDAHGLMDQWLVNRGNWYSGLPSIEARVNQINIDMVAAQLRMPIVAVNTEFCSSGAWVIHRAQDAPICPSCLLKDDLERRARYRRYQWSQSWRTHCHVHQKQWLIRRPDWKTTFDLNAHVMSTNRAVRSLPIYRGSSTNVGWREHTIYPVALADAAIRRIECSIRSALVGRRPRRSHWGYIEAADYLQVVQDATSLLLSRFESERHPPICWMDVDRFIDNSQIRCFSRHTAALNFKTVNNTTISLGTAGDVGWRRCALFWAYELPNIRSVRGWLSKKDKNNHSLRQAKILNRQTSAGLAWLSQRMELWPSEYRYQWWAGARMVGMRI